MDNDTAVSLARVRALVRAGEAERIRKAAGLSLGEVGASVGADPSTVHRWERGDRVPRGARAIAYLDLLERLAECVPVAQASG